MERVILKRSFVHGFFLIALTPVPMTAAAQTLSGNLNVQITIQDECTLGTIAGVDFGTQGILDSDITDEGSIQVTCSSGTAYTVSLDAGDGAGASEATRLMTRTSGGTQTIAYSLYRDPGHNNLWGSSSSAYSGTGDGSTQTLDVYGLVEAQATPPAGTYQDTVTVTLGY